MHLHCDRLNKALMNTVVLTNGPFVCFLRMNFILASCVTTCDFNKSWESKNLCSNCLFIFKITEKITFQKECAYMNSLLVHEGVMNKAIVMPKPNMLLMSNGIRTHVNLLDLLI